MPATPHELAIYRPDGTFPAAALSDEGSVGGEESKDLDARQDEVLMLLDELNARIETVIEEFGPPCAMKGSTLGEPATADRPASRAAA